MENEVKLNRFFPIDRESLFNYFIQPELLEQWSYPEGMTLKVPEFDAKVGGRFRYEHTSKDGQYVGIGHIKEFVPGEKLVLVDETLTGPDGKVLDENLECIMEFTPKYSGCELQLIHRGFAEEEFAAECEQSWNQCLNNLSQLVGRSSEYQRSINVGGPEAGMYE